MPAGRSSSSIARPKLPPSPPVCCTPSSPSPVTHDWREWGIWLTQVIALASAWWGVLVRLLAGRPGGRPRGVPSMGSVLLDERSQSGPMTATVAKPQGATARGKPKEAGGKLSTVGTRTGSEAGCGRQAGPEQRSPKVIKTHQVEPDGAREQSLHLTWGDLLGESRGEVSRGRISEEAA